MSDVDVPGRTYWCHQCSLTVTPLVSIDVACPTCHDGFIEEILDGDALSDAPPVSSRNIPYDSRRTPSRFNLRRHVDPHRLTASRLTSLSSQIESMTASSQHNISLLNNIRRQLEAGSRGHPADERGEATGDAERHRGDVANFLPRFSDGVEGAPIFPHSLGIQGTDSRILVQAMQGIIEQIESVQATYGQARLGAAGGGGDGPGIQVMGARLEVFVDSGGGLGPRRLPGALGDYYLGSEMEQILQHLADIDPNKYGTPPAAKAAVEAMPHVAIQQSHVDADSAVCAVCKDEFEVGTSAREMPCRHLYHAECILPWLKDHSSCPVCRHQLPVEEGEEGGGGCRDGEQAGGEVVPPPTMRWEAREGAASRSRLRRSYLWGRRSAPLHGGTGEAMDLLHSRGHGEGEGGEGGGSARRRPRLEGEGRRERDSAFRAVPPGAHMVSTTEGGVGAWLGMSSRPDPIPPRPLPQAEERGSGGFASWLPLWPRGSTGGRGPPMAAPPPTMSLGGQCPGDTSMHPADPTPLLHPDLGPQRGGAPPPVPQLDDMWQREWHLYQAERGRRDREQGGEGGGEHRRYPIHHSSLLLPLSDRADQSAVQAEHAVRRRQAARQVPGGVVRDEGDFQDLNLPQELLNLETGRTGEGGGPKQR